MATPAGCFVFLGGKSPPSSIARQQPEPNQPRQTLAGSWRWQSNAATALFARTRASRKPALHRPPPVISEFQLSEFQLLHFAAPHHPPALKVPEHRRTPRPISLSRHPRERASVLECGGPPPLFPSAPSPTPHNTCPSPSNSPNR